MSRRYDLDPLPGGDTPDVSSGSIQFIGTATVLIRYAGFTILTDPNFLHKGDHVHLGYGLTSKRLTDPAMDIHELPRLDFVVLSHLHEDHFDRVAERELERGLPIVTTTKAARALHRKGFQAAEPLPTWDTLSFRRGRISLDITAMPGRHGGWIFSRLLPPVMGSHMEFRIDDRPLLRLYITGDTLVYRDLLEIPKRYPDIDVALLHLGGTRVLGVLVTMDAKQGVEAMRIVRPKLAIPIHYNDYTVFKSPLEDFQREVRRAGLDQQVQYLVHGETWRFEVPADRMRAGTGPAEGMVRGVTMPFDGLEHRH